MFGMGYGRFGACYPPPVCCPPPVAPVVGAGVGVAIIAVAILILIALAVFSKKVLLN